MTRPNDVGLRETTRVKWLLIRNWTNCFTLRLRLNICSGLDTRMTSGLQSLMIMAFKMESNVCSVGRWLDKAVGAFPAGAWLMSAICKTPKAYNSVLAGTARLLPENILGGIRCSFG